MTVERASEGRTRGLSVPGHRQNANIVQVGIDYRTHSLSTIEHCVPSPEVRRTMLRRLVRDGLKEIALLATCHRVEFYAVAEEPEGAARAVSDRIKSLAPAGEGGGLLPVVRREGEAIRHLISTASGLESARLGEFEILGQIRRAYQGAKEADTGGPTLDRLFQHAIKSARSVRATLGFSQQRRSLTETSAEWLAARLENPGACSAAIVGAGETAVRMAERLAALGVGRLIFLNRDAEKARRLARRFGGEGRELWCLPETSRTVDVIVCATASPEPLLRTEHLSENPAVNGAATERALLIVDLGMPKNVDDGVARSPHVGLLNMSSIVSLALAESDSREDWTREARLMLDEGAEEFVRWRQARSIAPLLVQLRAHYETVIRSETSNVLPRTGASNGAGDDHAGHLTKRLSNKLLHALTLGLKEIAVEESPRRAEELAARLVLRDRATSADGTEGGTVG